ncbi:ICP22 family protein [Streptomyces xanthochromogenes]|uniref:hypothetical protein n=1 Tax=Streptomyces xanthochromogenes TaxID=67384 RepID=UPI00382AEF6C
MEKDATALAKQAGLFRDSGADVHKEFQGLSACYRAPEAEQLFATTAPVAAKSDAFADDLEKVAAALTVYGDTVRPLAKRLDDLRAQALMFTTSIEGDAHWHRDQDKVDRNNALKGDVEAAMQAFYEAEIACHNTITALVGGSRLVLGSYGKQKIVRMGTVEYGASAEDLSNFGDVPWGSDAKREFTGVDWLWHQGKSFVWDGFIVDGIGSTLKGIALLTGSEGWDTALTAWKGLAKVATGLALAITPGAGSLFLTAPDSMMPKWFRDSRTALKETGKALIAYDEWDKNPSRAAGGVTFNVLTTVFTGGAGTAAKGGAVAKTVSVLGKAGRVVDPMTYVFKAGGFGAVKVMDLFKNLKGFPTASLADTAHLTGPHVEWPDGARLSYADGEFTVTRPDGTTTPAHIELSAADRALLENRVPHHEPAMAGPHFGEPSQPPTHVGSEHGLGHTASHEPRGQDGAASGSHGAPHDGHGSTPDHDVEHSGHPASGSAGDTPDPSRPSGGDMAHTPGSRGADEWLTGARRRPRDILDDPAQTRWAENAYSDFLQNSRDIGAISDNTAGVARGNGSTGFTREEIAAVKKHIFDTEHPIEDYETGEVVTRKFDADAEIADAWIRLRSGNGLPEDHILLEHEVAELTYLRDHPGATYQEAHRVANETYNWQNKVPLNKREDFEGEW